MTVRVLHLLDMDAEFQTERGAAALARGLGTGFDVRVRRLGRGGYRNVVAAVSGLRREEPFDVVHAWGAAALTAAALAGRGRVLYSPDPAATDRSIRWTRAVVDHRDVHVVCPSATLRRAHVGRGVPLERCHVIRPGVDFARVRRRRDPRLRQRLGLVDDDYVLLVAGESTRPAAHREAVWATGILHVMDPRHKLVLWGRGPDVRRVVHFGDRQAANGRPSFARVAARALGRVEFEDLLPAADAVVVPARGPVATLPICIAMAAALPIVATVTYTNAELLEDRHTALLAPPGQPRQLARRILDLEVDTSLQWSIADMARTEAYEFFSLTRFLNQYRAVYRQLAAGEPVAVPEQPAGAGLRFHGRASPQPAAAV